MSVLDKFLNVMKLNDDFDDEYDEYDEYDDYEIEEKAKKKHYKKDDFDEYEEKQKVRSSKTASKVTPMRQAKKPTGGMEVCVVKPTTVEDSREITEILLTNRTVVLNLEGLDVEIAQRVIDFTSGSCFAINGNLQKISNYIFIITPAYVDISGDFQDILNGAFEVPPISAEF